MRRLSIIVAALLLAIVAARPTAAQSPTGGLTTAARALTAYLPTAAELPGELTTRQPATEFSNEDVVASDPDYAALIRQYGRITEVAQAYVSAASPGNTVVSVAAFRDAEGAWGDALDSTFPAGVQVRRTLPGPAVGERSVLFQYARGSGVNAQDTAILVFQRDRLEIAVTRVAPTGGISVETLTAVAQVVDAKVVAMPPSAVSDADRALLAEPTPAVLVRGAMRLIVQRYFEPVQASTLLSDAWQGAADALRAAGAQNVPAVPPYPADEDAALALHMRAFPELERLAQGKLTPSQLAYAAINGIVKALDDCHTYLMTPPVWERFKAQQTGGSFVAFGITFAADTPVRIVATTPGSPAQAAGLRRGQQILAINGTPVDGLTVTDARALLDPREGVPNSFRVQTPSGEVREISVAPARFTVPPLESRILPGNIGYMTFSTFQSTSEQVDLIKRTLTEWEAQGVQGWIIDLRDNGGGSAATEAAIASLFVSGGRLSGNVARGREPVYTNASGNPLPFQRPLAFLTGPGSASAAEILPGSLQARGRAITVGEQTAGCIGGFVPAGLLDGSALAVTQIEIVLGPDDLRLHRVGVSPTIPVAPSTPLEDEQGIDRQLDAALAAMYELTGQQAPGMVPVPMPPKPTTGVVRV